MEDTPVESYGQGRALTTTSFAVLAILAIRDHSTYQLTQQMKRSLHYLWPRAESNVYAEPKRLVVAGLAEAREQWTGDRRRTIYSITAAGRQALRRWLASPSSPQRYESEAALKAFFAENGSTQDLLGAIRALSADAAATIRHFRDLADQYERGKGEHPQRFALSGLVARLASEQQAATMRWAAWAEGEVAHWTSPSGPDPRWGVDALKKTGRPFPLAKDPVEHLLDDATGRG